MYKLHKKTNPLLRGEAEVNLGCTTQLRQGTHSPLTGGQSTGLLPVTPRTPGTVLPGTPCKPLTELHPQTPHSNNTKEKTPC